MIKKGVYAAGLSVLNPDRTLNMGATIAHAGDAIKNGLHGVFFLVLLVKANSYQLQKKKNLFLKLLAIN